MFILIGSLSQRVDSSETSSISTKIPSCVITVRLDRKLPDQLSEADVGGIAHIHCIMAVWFPV